MRFLHDILQIINIVGFRKEMGHNNIDIFYHIFIASKSTQKLHFGINY